MLRARSRLPATVHTRLGRSSLALHVARTAVNGALQGNTAAALPQYVSKRYASFPGGQFPGMNLSGVPQEKGAALKQFVSISRTRMALFA